MLALVVELLAGRYTAARSGNRDRPEWPPHPARLYSALVAVWAYEQPHDESERAVLSWLAEQGPPAITCSTEARQHERSQVVHYVPVNDVDVVESRWMRTYGAQREAERQVEAAAHGPERGAVKARAALDRLRAKSLTDSARLAAEGHATKDKLGTLPDRRGKQARTFPTTVPEDPIVRFTWPVATATEQDRRVLDALAARVSRLGHSSSPVSVRVAPDEDTVPTFVPADAGPLVLRVPAEGLLERLQAAHARHGGREPRTLPAALVPYAEPGPPAATTPASLLGSDWVVLGRRAGPRLPLPRALSVARLLRTALLRHADQPAPELLAGSGGLAMDGAKVLRLAVVPLPFVGRQHADGELLGVALIFPRATADADRQAVLRAAARWLEAGGELPTGAAGPLRLDDEGAEPQRATLRPSTWCRQSRAWASVTPVALEGAARQLLRATGEQRAAAEEQAIERIGADCAALGLPRPQSVRIDTDGPLTGVPPRRSFPPLRTGAGGSGVHVRLTFAAPVAGPILLGAGRWLGQGLLRPYRPGGPAT